MPSSPCRNRGRWILACVMLFVGAPAANGLAAPLPERHPYQKGLRDYFSTLTEADFVVTLQPVAYVEGAFPDADTLARYWLGFVDGGSSLPPDDGIRVAPGHFTLAALEAGDSVNAAANNGFMDPKDVAWWSRWDYPGNPYRGVAALQKRAFVMAAADMMMQDEEHEQGRNRRSDFLGGSMVRYAYVFWAVRDAVPAAARDAYAAGLVRMFEKLERMTPEGAGGSDMEFFQLVGMWYAADALGGDFPARALARAHVVIDTITSASGYEKHGAAFDVSYQGIALRFLTWAALLYDDPKVTAALHKMLVLKAHLSFPDPDGRLVGPTHFNTGTAADAPNDQWAWLSRDFAMAMVDDLALYTIWARTTLPSEAVMRDTIRSRLEKHGGTEPSPAAPAPWQEVHWSRTLPFAHDLYRQGSYARWVALEAADSPLTRPVYHRGERFIRDLNGGGEFLAVRFDRYAAVVHTGAIAKKWASGVSGKSGGSLSTFWTPAGGSVVMGRCRPTQSKAPDEWTDVDDRGPLTWAVHAITGRGAGGGFFSSSRIRDLHSEYRIEADTRAIVTVSGDLGGSADADPGDALKGTNRYTREFVLDATGVAVSSSLALEPADAVTELWEILPLHAGTAKAPADVAVRTRGEWRPITTTAEVADAIRVTRFGEETFVLLDAPRRLKAEHDGPRGFSGMDIRNVMIDLLPPADGRAAVSYRITTQP